jgi:hypothetical protein
MVMLMACLLLAASPDPKPLTAELLVTNQPGTVMMRLEQGENFKLANVKMARRGEPIAAFVVFSACGRDKEGNCDLRMDMVILDPGGKVYGESKGTEVWVGKAAPAAGTTQLSVGYLMIVIEPKDPPGRYRIKAHISDRISGAVLDREWPFDVASVTTSDSATWPADKPKPKLAGFWKDHCEDDFGLKIEPASGGLYSISFCGPGGCFKPGTYRPNSAIVGDRAYRVVDVDTLEVLGGDGFSKYYRCPKSSP